MNYLGDYTEDDIVYLMFNTYTSNDPSASSTITNFANTDVHIHKDDGLTQRNNAAGITVSVDFDGITGSHMIKIDTSDDTVGGFWVTGSDYFVRIEGTTVDGATINSVVGHFSIENRFNEVDVTKWLGTAVTANIAGQPTVDITRIGASTQSLIDLKDFVDSGYDPVENKVNGVILVDTTTDLTNPPADGDLTTAIPDSYSTDGDQPSITQAILEIHQLMMEKSISGTTLTVKKPDGSTTAMTFTLDSATSPTSITRAT